MPSISFVVARSYPGNVIGCENKLPWKLKSDLKRFREVTVGHAVIMGRKTFESIGRPLPNRFNVVLTQKEARFSDDLIFVQNRESALFFSDCYSILHDKRELFVIGGSEIYRAFYDLFNKIYLTQVFAGDIKGDAYFDFEIDKRQWKNTEEVEVPKSEGDQYPYRFSIYERRQKTVRLREISDFMTYREEADEFRSRYSPETPGQAEKESVRQAQKEFFGAMSHQSGRLDVRH